MDLMTRTKSAGEAALSDRFRPGAAGDAARAMLAGDGLPNRRVEAFKWTDLRAALAEGVAAPDGSAGMIPACLQEALVVDFAPDGLGLEGEKGAGLVIETEDGAPLSGAGPLAILAAAMAPRTLVLRVEASQTRPVVLRRHPGAPMRVRVEMAPGTALTLVDTALATAGLSTALIEAEVPEGARLVRISLQRGGDRAVELSHARVSVAAGGAYRATALAFGAKLARAETEVVLNGPDARCDLMGAYLLSGAAHADATTRVTHARPGGATRELYKGAVKDRARGVFQGKILVERPAQKTDARQNHHALLLSEGAELFAKPELEIYADDVACAHGNTVGALDERALFYMRQRGVPLAEARALLVRAFVAEVFDELVDEGVRDWLAGEAEDWLKGARP
jgi:Fe-S cluster assembly protein SufD